MAKLGDTLTITVNAVAKVLIKVNGPSNFQSEYLLRESLVEYRVRVRHTVVGGSNGGFKYDRHNFEIVKTTYATETVDEFYQKFYFVWEQVASKSENTLVNAICDLAIADSDELLDELSDLQS